MYFFFVVNIWVEMLREPPQSAHRGGAVLPFVSVNVWEQVTTGADGVLV